MDWGLIFQSDRDYQRKLALASVYFGCCGNADCLEGAIFCLQDRIKESKEVDLREELDDVELKLEIEKTKTAMVMYLFDKECRFSKYQLDIEKAKGQKLQDLLDEEKRAARAFRLKHDQQLTTKQGQVEHMNAEKGENMI